jgi:hypothetical protein
MISWMDTPGDVSASVVEGGRQLLAVSPNACLDHRRFQRIWHSI